MPCDRSVNVLLYLLFYYCAKLHLLLLCHRRIKFLLLLDDVTIVGSHIIINDILPLVYFKFASQIVPDILLLIFVNMPNSHSRLLL